MSSDECRLKSLFIQGLEGDQDAYRKFLRALSEMLCSYVRNQLSRLNRSDVDVEDIAQEALLAVHSRRHTYDRVTPVTAWARAIARYKLIDCLRTSRRSAHNLLIEDLSKIAGDDGPEIEAALDARRLFSALPSRLRDPIQCAKLEGLSITETSRKTGMSKPAVKVNIHRGLKMLAKALRGSQ